MWWHGTLHYWAWHQVNSEWFSGSLCVVPAQHLLYEPGAWSGLPGLTWALHMLHATGQVPSAQRPQTQVLLAMWGKITVLALVLSKNRACRYSWPLAYRVPTKSHELRATCPAQ